MAHQFLRSVRRQDIGPVLPGTRALIGKLQKLFALPRENDQLRDQEVLIFSEFRETGRYSAEQLAKVGFKAVEQVDSGRNGKNRETIIRRFAPFHYDPTGA